MAAPIWEVFNNIGLNSESHFRERNAAVQHLLGNCNAVWIANPGSYWRIDAWQNLGGIRMTIPAGPGANSNELADFSLIERSLSDFLQF